MYKPDNGDDRGLLGEPENRTLVFPPASLNSDTMLRTGPFKILGC